MSLSSFLFFVCLLGTPVLLIVSVATCSENKRRALGLLGASVCTAGVVFGYYRHYAPPSPPALLAEFSAQVRQVADPTELQKWAKTQPRIENPETARDTVPGALRKIMSQRSEMEMVTWDHNDDGQSVVTLWWGGGFRHWGLMIGQPNYKYEPDPMTTIASEWKPGIYFWVEQ